MATDAGRQPMPEYIVVEVSNNWPDSVFPGAAVVPGIVSKRFELVINHNRSRGYELHSWQLHRTMVANPDTRIHTPVMNETIVAVFRLTAAPPPG